MGKESVFIEKKRIAMEKLRDAVKNKKVDSKIMGILEKINKMNEYFTTSSCAGRIILLKLPEAGDKKNAVFIGKWHEKVVAEEIMRLIECLDDEIWFMVNPPIIHVGCKTMKDVKALLTVANQSGFKHSSIKSVGKIVFVEILSTERMDVPICFKGRMPVDEEYIRILVEIANKMMDRIDKKLAKLDEELSKMSQRL